MISDQELCWCLEVSVLNEVVGGVGGFWGVHSHSKSVYTNANAHIHISWSKSKRFVPTLWNPWDFFFFFFFFFLKVVPRVRMSHWPYNGATVTARPPLSSDSRRMPLWEGFWVALYSLHAEVLTPCVGPLTPHLPSLLMWLYWLWHTEHGDDDQTIKSPPPHLKREDH